MIIFEFSKFENSTVLSIIMSILEILNEQAAFGFSGKVNILIKESGQLFGSIFQEDGQVIDGHCGNTKGLKAVLKLIFLDVEKDNYFKYIVEPEIITQENRRIKKSYEEIKKIAEKGYQENLNSKKLRPPENLKLLVNPEIIVDKTEITNDEFLVLEAMTEWNKVSDVYNKVELLDYEITNALVSLRKKKAIKVLQN